MDDTQPIVIDGGSGLLKAGFSTNSSPRATFRPVIAYNKTGNTSLKDYYVGDAAERKRNLPITYPIEQGIITNWDAMEKIWDHMFVDELRCFPEEQPVLMTDATLNPKANREKIAEIMFEKFQIPGLFLTSPAPMALLASGRRSGVVLDCGESVTHAVALYEGSVITHSIKSLDLAGSELTTYITKLLRERYDYLTWDICKHIKEKNTHVAVDYNKEVSKPQKYLVEPDGQELTILEEQYKVPEVLFQPSLLGMEYEGIHKLIYNSIMATDQELTGDLFKNVIVEGGSTMFPGFGERLTKELSAIAPKNMNVKVYAPPERAWSVWIGANMLSSLSVMQELWVTRRDYDENGARTVHTKCLI